MDNRKILFLGKKGDVATERAEKLVRAHFVEVESHFGNFGDPVPPELAGWRGDYLLSYLCPWVVKEPVLKSARFGAINFHPGPPQYPGVGCTNFAIYHEEKEFGVTAHFMAPGVDSGKIVAVRRFPVSPSDSVHAITLRCYAEIEVLFREVLEVLKGGGPLPEANEHWKRRPFTRKELNELCRLTPEMSETEMLRRIRAVTFPGKPGAYLELRGKKFNLTELP
jgi:methionyl-tRNA formyltransferase